ncbi:MAG: CBS domain-containing protein [Deltaproteobacteria bacterium]|nr:CBS domain-containing protein [Deltaproteobacteria bacterium]
MNHKKFIKELIPRNPVTISPETTFVEAREIIQDKGITHLPVVDKHNNLIGLVADRDIRETGPSDASSLSILEVNYLLVRLKVSSFMTPLDKLITINPDTPPEDAVQLMHDNKIGCLPVVEDGVLYGIFTETDALSLLVDFLGRPLTLNESLCSKV